MVLTRFSPSRALHGKISAGDVTIVLPSVGGVSLPSDVMIDSDDVMVWLLCKNRGFCVPQSAHEKIVGNFVTSDLPSIGGVSLPSDVMVDSDDVTAYAEGADD